MARRFKAQDSTISRELRTTMDRMGVTRWDRREKSDGTAIIAFVRPREDGMEMEYQFTCNSFEHPHDNMRACQKAIKDLWHIYEDYQITTTDVPADFGTLIMGFQVGEGQRILAITDGAKACWDILELPKSASVDEIKRKYRELVKIHHPDKGGDKVEFERLTQAKDEFLELKVR